VLRRVVRQVLYTPKNAGPATHLGNLVESVLLQRLGHDDVVEDECRMKRKIGKRDFRGTGS